MVVVVVDPAGRPHFFVEAAMDLAGWPRFFVKVPVGLALGGAVNLAIGRAVSTKADVTVGFSGLSL